MVGWCDESSSTKGPKVLSSVPGMRLCCNNLFQVLSQCAPGTRLIKSTCVQ